MGKLSLRLGRSAALLCLAAVLAPYCAAAQGTEELTRLQHALREMQEQNRELARRLDTLESATAATQSTEPKVGDTSHEPSAARWSPTVRSRRAPAPKDTWETETERSLDVRVKDLEVGQGAQEHATRQIIQDTLAKTGPKINSLLSLSGVLEFNLSQSRDFAPEIDALHPFGRVGAAKDVLVLGTVELDFDIKASDWLTGAVVVSYDNGSTKFLTSTGTSANVDRFSLDRAHVTVGDLMQFPIAARFGFEVQHFGTSTGVARLDTLSLTTPLTTAVFENRQTAGGLEFALPTPPLGPLPAPVVEPPVEPLFLAPLVKHMARGLGYTPAAGRVAPLTPVRPLADLPPLYGSFMLYKGSEEFGDDRTRIQDFNASVGFRTRGHCGRPYEELKWSLICPWTFDAHVDYASNVFEGKFLHTGYLPFLLQIGSVQGVAGSVKASFGPFAVVGEVNSAMEDAVFVDALGIVRNIRPAAWQASLAYQFGWNPWVREIGAQGDFISVTYSGSHDLAGAVALVNGLPNRVGFVPASRLAVTAGEWVLPELKVAAEYSANWDYPENRGGTGKLVHGVFGLVQFNF